MGVEKGIDECCEEGAHGGLEWVSMRVSMRVLMRV